MDAVVDVLVEVDIDLVMDSPGVLALEVHGDENIDASLDVVVVVVEVTVVVVVVVIAPLENKSISSFSPFSESSASTSLGFGVVSFRSLIQ